MAAWPDSGVVAGVSVLTVTALWRTFYEAYDTNWTTQ
jgi:hypothetical protein